MSYIFFYSELFEIKSDRWFDRCSDKYDSFYMWIRSTKEIIKLLCKLKVVSGR